MVLVRLAGDLVVALIHLFLRFFVLSRESVVGVLYSGELGFQVSQPDLVRNLRGDLRVFQFIHVRGFFEGFFRSPLLLEPPVQFLGFPEQSLDAVSSVSVALGWASNLAAIVSSTTVGGTAMLVVATRRVLVRRVHLNLNYAAVINSNH